jgi:hypothetical protein
VIQAQRASILMPYDHRHINHEGALASGHRTALLHCRGKGETPGSAVHGEGRHTAE